MAQVPECVVCLQPYDDFLHVPRVLACGHSFCELCLMQLQSSWQSSSSSANNNNDNDSPAAAKGAMIRCPECSHRTRLPLGGQQSLPKNVELLRLLPSLIREADSTNIGRDSGEASSASPLKEPVRGNGNTNNRAAAVTGRRKGHHLNAAGGGGGGAESRSSVYGRRPKTGGKGKQRIDSNSDSGSSDSGVNRSWLLPLDLYSKNSDKISDMRAWILPEKAIKLRGGEENSSSPRVTVLDSNHLCGEILLERERLSNSVPVRLRQLTEVSCAPHPQQDHETTNMSYEESVLTAWEGCHYEVKTELLILLRVSVLTRGLCKFLGVWLNCQRNALFLVTQSLAPDEDISAWEMIKASFQHRELSPNFKPEIDERPSTSGRDSAVSVSSAASDMTLPAELSEAPLGAQQKFSSSAVVEQMRLSRVGLELCGTLCEVHSQGLIFGLLSPNCFALDQLGSLLIDLNAALNERSSLHDITFRLRNSSGKCNSEGGGACGIVNSAPEDDFLKVENYRNSCWRYMSPEALSLLIPSNENQTTMENDASSSSSSDKLQNRLTCQTDVWSVGCLFLEWLSGKVPYEGFTFQEVLHKVLVEREKPGNFPNLLDSDAAWAKNLTVFLSKCFEYDPDERPQLDILRRDLMEFGLWSNVATPTRRTGSTPPEQQHLQSEQAADSAANQKYWVLCLPGFVVDGYPDSWHGQVADVQESQRRLSLLMVDNGAAADDGRELQHCGLEQKASLEGHQDYVTALAVCGDSLLSASFDKTIRVWSIEDRAWQLTLQRHSYTVVALAVDHNASRCFSGDTGGTICVWDIGEDTPEQPLVTTWQEHDDWRYTGVASLAVSADGILYSGSGDRTVKSWSLQNFNCLGIMEGHKGLVSSLLVDGELLYSGSWDGTIHVWWRSDQSLVSVLGGGTAFNPFLGGVRTLCMSDSFLFAGRDNGAIQVWRDEECLTTVKAHDNVVSTLYVEGDFLYTGSWDQQIKAWKLDEFLSDPSPTLVKQCGSALSSLVSDGDQLYAGLADRAIKVYSLLGDTWASLVQML